MSGRPRGPRDVLTLLVAPLVCEEEIVSGRSSDSLDVLTLFVMFWGAVWSLGGYA